MRFRIQPSASHKSQDGQSLAENTPGFPLPGANYGESTTKLLKGRKPTVDIAPRLIFCQPISLLKPAFQLIALAIDSSQIIIRDLAPLLLDLPAKLFPITFDPIPVHDGSPY
jgi:hypothetical protein